MFIISYQCVAMKIKFHYLLEFTSLNSKSILKPDVFFSLNVNLLSDKKRKKIKHTKWEKQDIFITTKSHSTSCRVIIEFPSPQVVGTKSSSEAAFLTGGVRQNRNQSESQHPAMTSAGTGDTLISSCFNNSTWDVGFWKSQELKKNAGNSQSSYKNIKFILHLDKRFWCDSEQVRI